MFFTSAFPRLSTDLSPELNVDSLSPELNVDSLSWSDCDSYP